MRVVTEPKLGGRNKRWRHGRGSGWSRSGHGVEPGPAGGAAAWGRGVVPRRLLRAARQLLQPQALVVGRTR